MNQSYNHEIVDRYDLFAAIAGAVEAGYIQAVVDTVDYSNGRVQMRYAGSLGNLALHPEGLGIELRLEKGTSQNIIKNQPAQPLDDFDNPRLISPQNPYFINYTAGGVEIIGTKNDDGWCRTVTLTEPAENPNQPTLPNLN